MKRTLFIIAAAIVSVTMSGQQARELPNDPAVRKGTLDNGMTYYIMHNAKPAERAEFYLATSVGAIQETPEQDGLAHFLEHMCFNGTKNFPDKTLLEYLQKIGVEFGRNINASTGTEQTIYMLSNIPVVRESIVDTCLLIMHDYSHFVTNDPVEIDKERGVIIEEKRTRNTASWRMFEKSQPYLYGDSKYNGCTIIGSQENLENFKPEYLNEFYHTWYRPDLQALIVVGDIDVDQIEAKIKATFADIPQAENPKAKEVHLIPDNEKPIIGIIPDPECTQTTVSIYWKTKPTPKEQRNTDINFLSELVKSYINHIMAERFADIAAKTDAPFLRAGMRQGDLVTTSGVILVNAGSRDGESIAAFKAVLSEIEKMKKFGFTQEEVNRAKDSILREYEQAVEAAESRMNTQLIYPLIYNFFDNEPYMTPEAEYQLAEQFSTIISAAMLNATAAQLIPENNMVIIYNGPEKEGVTPTEEEFLAAIEEVASSDIQANEAEEAAGDLLDPDTLTGSKVKKETAGLYGSTEWTLQNGIKVVVLPTDYKKDEIIIRVRRMGGRSLIATEDLPSFESNVTTVFESQSGISSFPKTTLNKMLAGKKARVSFTLGNTSHGLSASCPPKELETALQLVYLKYTDPRFDQEEYNVAMSRLEAILPNFANNPTFRFSEEVLKTIYNNNPRDLMISEEVLEKASLQTYERVYRELFKDAAGTEVYIVGNVDILMLKPLVEKYLGSITKGKKATDWVEANVVKRADGRAEDLFSIPMQTPKNSVYIMWRQADTQYTIPRKVACDAVKYIMGMIYTDTLREDEGGTYGAGTSCTITRDPYNDATMVVQFDTRVEMCDKLREIAKAEFKKIADEGPSEEYFSRTIENMKKQLPEQRITNSYWLSSLMDYAEYGTDYDAWYEAAVELLTPEDVRKMAQDIYYGGNFFEVVMSPEE